MNEFFEDLGSKRVKTCRLQLFPGTLTFERRPGRSHRPEFVKFWTEIASLGRKHVLESVTPAESRAPEELSIRAKRSATMRSRKQGRSKLRGTKKTEHQAILNTFTSGLQGLTPASGGGIWALASQVHPLYEAEKFSEPGFPQMLVGRKRFFSAGPRGPGSAWL